MDETISQFLLGSILSRNKVRSINGLHESEFFQNVVNQHDIVSWVAVDQSRPDGQSDELIGFITAHIVFLKDSDIGDLLKYDPTKPDEILVYILTLGVVEIY